jgi:hypothetical protein
MKAPRFLTILAVTLLVGGTALPAAAAGGERRPHSRSSTHSSSRSGGEARTAVPRSAMPRGEVGGSHEVQRRPSGTAQRTPHRSGDRSHSDRYYPRGHYYYPYGYSDWTFPWGWGLGVYWYYPWYPWWGWGGGYYPYQYPYYYGHEQGALGALDLDIRPEKAQVYLDGQLIGVADNFDGWPRYLWLPEGTYDLVFYLDGFQTIARQYSIYGGVIIDVEDTMVPGKAVRPEDLASKSTERRDERLKRREERGEMTPQTGEPAWRERVKSEREEMKPGEGEKGALYDARSEPARLSLEVSPADAAVYLDGRFLGTAGDLARTHPAIAVDPGEHELQVVRPGYEAKRSHFTAEAGEEVKMTVELVKE